MARRGAKARIDLAELEKLSALQCTDEEIGAWFGVSPRTIARRRKVRKFSDVMTRGRAKGRISVRRAQMKILDGGNASMGIWLGKQLLGQTDQVTHEVNAQVTTAIILLPGPDDVDKLLPATDDAFHAITVGDENASRKRHTLMPNYDELRLSRYLTHED